MASMAVTLVIMMIVLRFHCSDCILINGESFCSDANIKPGFTLSPTSNRSSLPSTSGYFEFGFYPEREGFAIGIWLVTFKEKTVVWTANRDDPPFAADSLLQFDREGELAVWKKDGARVVIARAAGVHSVTSASLLDSGNLILCDYDSRVVWESFQRPTDTILPGQVLPSGGELFSSASDADHSTGRFRLKMQVDGNLVLYPKDTEDTSVEAYWATSTFCKGCNLQLYLNTTGILYIVNATTVFTDLLSYDQSSTSANFNSSGNTTTIFRAALDSNGNFRVYSHLLGDIRSQGFPKVWGDGVSVKWAAIKNPCDVKDLCGFNSYCTLNDGQATCVCIPGTERRSDDAGCFRNYTRGQCLANGAEDKALYSFAKMENMGWEGSSYEIIATLSAEDCGESCSEDCNCDAAIATEEGFVTFVCKKQMLPLRSVRRDFSTTSTAFFKIGNVSKATSTANPPTLSPPLSRFLVDNDKALTRIVVLALGSIALSCIALAISGFYIVKIRVLRYNKLRDDGTLGMSTSDQGLTLRVFSYNELKRATNSFKEQLGKGSFGAVYKGSLNKGRTIVAVKRLEKLMEEGEREFRAEMRAIGRTNHKNLVRLLGYCAEGSKRLLVYEYMSNGSLADLLFQAAQRIHWSERARFALEVARGILYLHEECKTLTIHCDIKPQNILMDESWTAKIADFGLAKFLQADQTRTFTMIRGTRGYVAPEWQKNVPISVKVDVYSYGIVLLEIICCRRNLEVGAVNPDEVVLSNWAYQCFMAGEVSKLVAGQEFDKKTLDNMVKVALWCIQDQPALRPSMKSVVLMLQGITDVAIPPRPTSP